MRVSGTGTTSSETTFTVPSREVWVAPICYYIRMGSGREYATALNNGLDDSVIRMLPEAERRTPLPGWQLHEEDDEGAWWIPTCSDMSRFPAYNALNDPVYVSPGETVPEGESSVTPEVLADIAYDEMDLPSGTIRWNPSLEGSGATVVNLDTWVWVEDGPTEVSITASVPGVSATVDAELDHLSLSAPGADPVTCPGPGVVWSPAADASTACAISFYRSTAKDGTVTLSATATWTASWTSSLDPTRTALLPQDIPNTAEIAVAEIQSIGTR